MKKCEYCSKRMPDWKHRFCNRSCSGQATSNLRHRRIDGGGDYGLTCTEIMERKKQRREMEKKYGFVYREHVLSLFDFPVQPTKQQPEKISNTVYDQEMREITGMAKKYVDRQITLNELILQAV